MVDIDGTLTTDEYRSRSGRLAIDAGKTKALASLARRASAKIVITSTWRRDAALPALLRDAGIGAGAMFDPWRTRDEDAGGFDALTGDRRPRITTTRAEEVERFVVEHGITRCIVFDDEPMHPRMASSHVMPDAAVGLSSADFERAERIIGGWGQR